MLACFATPDFHGAKQEKGQLVKMRVVQWLKVHVFSVHDVYSNPCALNVSLLLLMININLST